jgi:hypothetical protein
MLPTYNETKGGSGTPFNNVNVNVYTQDAGALLEELRRRGVDLEKFKRG